MPKVPPDQAPGLLKKATTLYRSITSYTDSGTVQRRLSGGAPVSSITFSTWYRRPTLFRCEFSQLHPTLGRVAMQHVVGFDGNRAYSLTQKPRGTPELTLADDLPSAIAAAAGISCGAVQTIGRLVFMHVAGNSILDLVDVHSNPDTAIEAVPCYSIFARYPHGGTVELWLEKQALLLRRTISRLGKVLSTEARDNVRINVPIDDALFKLPQ